MIWQYYTLAWESIRRPKGALLEATEITKLVVGKKHPSYAYNLHNLATVCTIKQPTIPRPNQSCWRPWRLRSWCKEKLVPSYAATALLLGHLYTEMREYAKGEPLFLESIDIWKQLSFHHYELARGLVSLAGLYVFAGKYTDAQPLLIEALKIETQVPGMRQRERRDLLERPGVLLLHNGGLRHCQ